MNIKCFMEAEINGKKVKAYIIDQGSKCITIKQREAEMLALKYEKLITHVITRGFGNGQIQSMGRFKQKLKWAKRKQWFMF